MSKIDALIQELCPEGVEYKTLGEIFNTRNGYTPSKSKPEFWEGGNIPWFRMEDIRENGNILYDSIQHITHEGVKGELIPKDSLIVATSATVGVHAIIKTDAITNQRFTCLTLKGEYAELYDVKFLFYYCYKLDEYCLNHLNKGNFASVNMEQFHAFPIPVPPLSIQREIVRILDAFTELTTKLSAELTLRRRQYEYYRDKLLSFEPGVAPLCPLREISDILTGYPFDSAQFSRTGIRLLRGMNVKRGELDFSEENNRYWSSDEGFDAYQLEEDDVIIAMDGSLVGKSFGYVKKEHLPALLVQRVARIRAKGVNPRFLFHCVLNNFTDYVERKKTGGTVPHISKKDIEEFQIPLPSLSTQERLVRVLDNFDAICQDLDIGLPAEITARKKQYEYYRDQLLNFAQFGAINTKNRRIEESTRR